MPIISNREDLHHTRSFLTLLAVFACFFLTASTSFGIEQGQNLPNVGHPTNKALSFSRRGLENANRLSTSQDLNGNSDGGNTEELRPQSVRDLVLSDIVLVSSVEGGIYGLERSSGKTRWTLAPRIKIEKKSGSQPEDDAQNTTTTYGGAAPAGFSPLIGTSYGPDRRSFSDLANNLPLINSSLPNTKSKGEVATGHEALEALQELGLYVVEPSTGHVYVLTTTPDPQGPPKTSLSKLPLSLPQLVDLSPFSFPGDSSRVFVGHKSTSLVEIDIQTGKIGAVFGGGQDAGVWCDSPGEEVEGDECGHDQYGKGDWAYFGRTDYTLTIHLRGRPTLSQTLKFSTFAPNTADRDVSSMWVEGGISSDARVFMGMPDEGTVVCFDAQGEGGKKRAKDNTLWISELGATVAGIFDVVYSAPHLSNRPPRPMIVPHPNIPLRSLFPSSPLTSIRPSRGGSSNRNYLQAQEHTTLLGIADGHLYAMGGQHYPLISFSPRAPAGQDSNEGHLQHGHHQPSCSSFGCLLGTYDVQSSEGDQSHREGLYGFEVGHAPLLGIGDGRAEVERRESDDTLPNSSTIGQVVTPLGPSSDNVKAEESSTLWSWSPTPMMMMIQIVALLLLAVLCGLVYVGAQEMQRQRSEDAKAIAKDMIWLPQAVVKEDVKGDVKADLGQKEEQMVEKEAAEKEIPLRDPEQVARELLKEEEEAAAKADKKKPVKRRRRGKRGGAVVQQREARKDGSSKADDESCEEDGEEDNGMGASKSTSSATEEAMLQNGVNVNSSLLPAQEEAIIAAARTPMSAEGGSSIPPSNGHGPVTARGGQSLLISEDVLGYGSSGTIVFKGTFQGRAVAVKRLLRDFVDVASKEVSLLESADNHPNVIRYFYKEVTSTFLFIALELCPASLAEIIEKPNEHQELSALLNPKKALFQIASGLQHLHSLHIVHRDIKPQNILVSYSPGGRLKMLLSDFGLSKRLDGMAQTSFSQTVNNPGGTVGWRAPEILRGDVLLDMGDESSTTSSTNTTKDGSGIEVERKRLTRAVDIFALGCLTYYVLSNGEHPFGSRYEREMNIIRKQIDLQRLDGLGEEGHEAQHLVLAMIQFDAKDRPSATKVLSHPYFWSPGRRLSFLQDASDRFDIMEKDPPAPALIALEEGAITIVGTDWHRKIDKQFMEDLGKRRKYDCKSVVDLLRAIRNKKHHIHDLPPNLKRLFANLPDGFLAYFTSRFPKLFLHTYEVVDSFAVLKSEAMFALYFAPVSDDV